MPAPSESPFLHAVGDLLADHALRRTVAIDAAADWRLEASSVVSAVTGSLLLQGTGGGVYLSGSVATTAHHACDRCLTEWDEQIGADVAELIGGEDAEYPLDGDVADLEAPLRDAVLLALPLRPLCRPDCAGLCSTCGADLNTGACPGHDDEADTPFTALRGLLEP